MTRRLLDHNPDTGVTEYYHGEPDGSFVIETVQDHTALIEQNKAIANDNTGRWKDGQLVAQYPMTIWHDLKQKGILDDPKAYRKWLNDPSNAVFRIKRGRI